MSQWMSVLNTVLPVAVMLGIGVIARKSNMLSRENIAALKRVVMDIALPAVLLGAFAGASYNLGSLLLPLIMFLVCLAALGLGKAARRLLRMDSPFVPFLTSGYEAGMLGYALFAMLYGQEHTASFALLDLGQVLFVFTAYKALLARSRGERMTPVETAKSLLSSPTIWAICAGVLLGATGLYRAMVPSGAAALLSSVTDFISAPTGALILLTIGYDLDLGKVRWGEALKMAGVRLAISAALMGLMLLITGGMFPGDNYLRGAVLLMFMLPPPYVLPILADDPDQRACVSSTLCVLTLFTILYFAATAFSLT